MSERVLDRPPALGGLFARAGAGAALGAARGLPVLGSLVPRAGAGALPETMLRLEDVAVDRERLARYSRVCGFQLSDSLPVTYPHVLAFPLQLALMTDPAFPFPAIGLVHISNEIVRHRAIDAGERLSLRVWAERLHAHPRGSSFALRSEVRAGDELVWEETSVDLRRQAPPRSHAGSTEPVSRTPPPEAAISSSPTATWKLAADLGRRYGAVAGDLNPIHMHALSAKLFGFPRAIAHGMWTKARCLAALEPLGASVRASVEFRKPILLPAKVDFLEHGERFEVRSVHGLHLSGTASPAR